MESKKFKTNIKCTGCIATVTPHLNEVVGEGKWEVDLNAAEKTLSVPASVPAPAVKAALEKAGYKATDL